MSKSFGDLEGVETDFDDILVWGTTAEEHDHRLKKTLQRCQELNLTLNESKCEFGTTKVIYIGHKLTAQGVKPDESKVDAINKMPQPTCKKDAERLLGMVNYFAKFIPQMSMITDPIRKVMKSDVEFKWGKQEEAFRQIKEILSSSSGAYSNNNMRCFKIRPWCSIVARGKARCICVESPDGCRNKIRPN